MLTGGKRSDRFDKGYFFEPTVLTEPVAADAKMMTEEPFAPVMPLLDFSKLDDVIAAANNTRYGLAAYVFTNDLTMAWKMAEGLEAGIIGINDPVPATPQCPFGGMKESGLGRELGHEGLEAYLETKYVVVQAAGCLRWRASRSKPDVGRFHVGPPIKGRHRLWRRLRLAGKMVTAILLATGRAMAIDPGDCHVVSVRAAQYHPCRKKEENAWEIAHFSTGRR